MEAASLPLAASRFLSPPATAPSCSRPRSLPFVRAAPKALEARDVPKTLRTSRRRSAVAEVKAATDPVAALTRYLCPQPYCSWLTPLRASFYVVVANLNLSCCSLWIIPTCVLYTNANVLTRNQVKPFELICRLENVLKTQDCNIILRHYGEIRRWDMLSKVVTSMAVLGGGSNWWGWLWRFCQYQYTWVAERCFRFSGGCRSMTCSTSRLTVAISSTWVWAVTLPKCYKFTVPSRISQPESTSRFVIQFLGAWWRMGGLTAPSSFTMRWYEEVYHLICSPTVLCGLWTPPSILAFVMGFMQHHFPWMNTFCFLFVQPPAAFRVH
jgi:hypothetical protein